MKFIGPAKKLNFIILVQSYCYVYHHIDICSLDMLSSRNTHKLTRNALLLVGWVICFCLASNMSFIQGCKVNYGNSDSAISTVLQANNIGDGSGFIDGASQSQSKDGQSVHKCDLSEHLINFDHHQVNDQAIFTYFILVVVVLWLLSTVPYFPPFTEPILHKGRRIHLKVCVFKE